MFSKANQKVNKSLDEILNENPELLKITQPLIVSAVGCVDSNANFDFEKTWVENGFDELDVIEIMMHIEKELSILIDDEIVEIFFNVDQKPMNVLSFIRNKRLEMLGI